MFGSENRDETHFANPDIFDVNRDMTRAVFFGAEPQFCEGAEAACSLIEGGCVTDDDL